MPVRNAEPEPPLIAHSLEIGRKRIHVRGIVQGVGFRPFVYRLAHEFGLGGSVQNTADGVLIEVEGRISLLARFLELLPVHVPPLAQIDELTVETL
jgi:hydrogenase maturation protein HypF